MPQNNIDTRDTTVLKNVLVTRFSALGDVALCVPVLYSVCRCYPQIRFTMVTRPYLVPIFVNRPANLEVVGADIDKKYTGVNGMVRLAAELNTAYSPDAYVDLHNVLRTKIIAVVLRMHGVVTSRLFKDRRHRKTLTRRMNKVMVPMMSQIERYCEAFGKIGLPVAERFDGLYADSEAVLPDVFDFDITTKAQDERFVGIAPFAAHAGKIYPPEQMEAVVAGLVRKHQGKIRIFLFGGGDNERTILDRWAEQWPDTVVSLAGKKYGFAAELALMNRMDLMVVMDSGNMHLAAIAGAKTLSIWGATHPYCGFKAWRQSEDCTIQLPMNCRPCSVFGNKPCHRGDMLCLKAITPDVIYKKIIEEIY